MKFYIKLFVIAFVGFLALFSGVLFAFESFYVPTPTQVADEPTTIEINSGNEVTLPVVEPGIVDERTELQKIAEASDRINIIAFGLNNMLADTMMLFSFDPVLNKLDIVSIPRDTYHHVEGHDTNGQKKMNAVYGFRDIGGVNGMKKYLSDFLGIPIHYYIKVDFKAVEAVVDTLGGYEVTVPFDMLYDDYQDTPALHINLKKGYQVLDGENAVKYLRFRQNNSKTISEGDIQRIPRQQHFVSTMMDKALSFKLPSVINTIVGGKYVSTDMTLQEALGYAVKGAALTSDDIKFYTVAGVGQRINGTDYWIHDPDVLEKMIYGIYGFPMDDK